MQPKLLESPLLDSEHVVKVACGARHTLLLTKSGTAFAFGHNKFGALGTGSFADAQSPAPVVVPAGKQVVDVAAGWWHTLLVVE